MSKIPVLPVCPYFQKERPEVGKSVCEGAVIRFPGTKTRAKFLSTYCADMQGYKLCPVCQMMDEYYATHDEKPDIPVEDKPTEEERARHNREKKAESRLRMKEERKKQGVCTVCGKALAATGRTTCDGCLEKQRAGARKSRQRQAIENAKKTAAELAKKCGQS